jgi:hypothetical protein
VKFVARSGNPLPEVVMPMLVDGATRDEVPRWPRVAAALCLLSCLAVPAALKGQASVIHTRNVPPVAGTPGRFDTLLLRESEALDSAGAVPTITDAAMDGAGRIMAVDLAGQRILVLDQRGQLVGSLGRSGDGPGEFRMPSLLAVLDGGGFVVLDVRTMRLTRFDRDLRLVGTGSVPSLHPTAMLALGEELFIAGALRVTGAEGKAIHVFSLDGRHLRSFGRLVEAAVPAAQSLVEGGELAPARSGGVWYSQVAPYLIERYSRAGDLELQIQRPNDFLPSAELALRMQVSERMTRFEPPVAHARAAAILELDDGTLLAQTRLPTRQVVTDLYRLDATGALNLVASYQHAGPVLRRRGAQRGTYVSLVARDGSRSGAVMVVRFTPARQN